MEPLTEEQEDKILTHMHYTKEQLELDFAHLKEWLKEQHHLPPSRLEEKDSFLKMYLTGCKGSLEAVKRKLDGYYTLRGKSDVYRCREVLQKEYRESCKNCCTVLLPKPTADGEYLFICKVMDSDVKSCDMLNIAKRIINLTEMGIRLREINTSIYVLLDYEHFTPAHSLLFSPTLSRDILHLVQHIFPLRIKQLIFFNVHSFLEVVLNTVVKPFLSKKMKERIYITSGGYEEVHKMVDKSVLPKEYGGDQKSIQEYNAQWNEYETSLNNWFVNELSEETDESKRVTTGNDFIMDDSYFGVQGSLKKLVID